MTPASSPSLELPQIFQLKRVESHRLAQEQQRCLVTVVDRPETAVGGTKIDESHVRLVPILEWKLALNTLIVRARERGHFILRAIPLVLLSALHRFVLRQGARRAAEEGNGVLQLRVREPAAAAVPE